MIIEKYMDILLKYHSQAPKSNLLDTVRLEQKESFYSSGYSLSFQKSPMGLMSNLVHLTSP